MSALLCALVTAGLLATADPPTTADLKTQAGSASAISMSDLDLGLLLSLERSALVLGIDQEVMLRVSLPADAVGDMGRVTIRTTAGEIIDVARDNSRTMSAKWVLPSRRFPQAAILVASTDDLSPRMAVLYVPLPAVASPAFHTDPGAEVSLRVAGQMFGPKRANASGEVRVPVIVPPGAEMAVAISKNEHGRTAEEALNLGHPPFQRMMLVAPASAKFGTPTDVWAFGIDGSARPLATGMMSVKSQNKSDAQAAETWAQPLEERPGFTHFLVMPPSNGAGEELILKGFDQPARKASSTAEPPIARTQTELTLIAGSPTRLIMIPNRIHMTVASRQTTTVVVRAEDAFGNPTSAEEVKVYVDGMAVGNVERLGGPVRIVVPAPRESVRPERLRIEAVGKTAYGLVEVVLDGIAKPPAPRELYTELEHHSALTITTAVVWNPEAGAGLGAWVDGETSFRKLERWPQNIFVSGSVGVLHRSKTFLSADSLERLSIQVVPLLLGARWRTTPAHGISVILGASAGTARMATTTTTLGDISAGNAWVPAFRVFANLALGQGPFQLVVGLSHLQLSGAQLSSGDSLTGNLGGWEVAIGGRRRW